MDENTPIQCTVCGGEKRQEDKIGIYCPSCKETVFSRGHRHNFVSCKCNKVFADGGDGDYGRFGWNTEDGLHHRYEDGTKVCMCQLTSPSVKDVPVTAAPMTKNDSDELARRLAERIPSLNSQHVQIIADLILPLVEAAQVIVEDDVWEELAIVKPLRAALREWTEEKP